VLRQGGAGCWPKRWAIDATTNNKNSKCSPANMGGLGQFADENSGDKIFGKFMKAGASDGVFPALLRGLRLLEINKSINAYHIFKKSIRLLPFAAYVFT
jgi:hypothetical protein